MLMRNNTVLGALILLAAQSLTACVMDAEGDDPLLLDEGDLVGEQSQELGEFSCTSSAVSLSQPDGAALTFQYPRCSYATTAATSMDGTYDQSLCPNQFVTEVRSVNGLPFTAFVEAIPASTITSQSACEGIAVHGAAWGLSGNNWVNLGSVSFAGTWHPASCGPLLCFPAYCDLSQSIVSTSGFSKVRVTGWAAALFLFKGRVRTGVSGGPGPC